MKESEFYHTAFENPAFRRQKLEELHHFKQVGVGLLAFVSVCFVTHTIYAGLKDGSWDGAMGWLAALAITGGGFSICSTRVAALEAIEERAPNKSPQRNASATSTSTTTSPVRHG